MGELTNIPLHWQVIIALACMVVVLGILLVAAWLWPLNEAGKMSMKPSLIIFVFFVSMFSCCSGCFIGRMPILDEIKLPTVKKGTIVASTGKTPVNGDKIVWEGETICFPPPDPADGDVWFIKIDSPSLLLSDKRYWAEGVEIGRSLERRLPADTKQVFVFVWRRNKSRAPTDDYEVKKR